MTPVTATHQVTTQQIPQMTQVDTAHFCLDVSSNSILTPQDPTLAFGSAIDGSNNTSSSFQTTPPRCLSGVGVPICPGFQLCSRLWASETPDSPTVNPLPKVTSAPDRPLCDSHLPTSTVDRYEVRFRNIVWDMATRRSCAWKRPATCLQRVPSIIQRQNSVTSRARCTEPARKWTYGHQMSTWPIYLCSGVWEWWNPASAPVQSLSISSNCWSKFQRNDRTPASSKGKRGLGLPEHIREIPKDVRQYLISRWRMS